MTHTLKALSSGSPLTLSGAIVCDSLMTVVCVCVCVCVWLDFRGSEARAPGQTQREVCGTIQPGLHVLRV